MGAPAAGGRDRWGSVRLRSGGRDAASGVYDRLCRPGPAPGPGDQPAVFSPVRRHGTAGPLEERLCGPARPAARHSGRSGDGWGGCLGGHGDGRGAAAPVLRRLSDGHRGDGAVWQGPGALRINTDCGPPELGGPQSVFGSYSANAAHDSAQDQHQQGDAAEQVFGHGVKPAAQGLAAGQVDLLQHIVLSAYPEEHHCGQQGADGADVDGAHIHPVGHDGGDDQPDAHAEGAGDSYGRGALQVEQLLKGGGGGLKQVDQRGQGGEEHRQEKHHQQDGPARQAADHIGQENEHQARAAVVQLFPGHRHSGDDDQGGQHGGQSVKQGDHLGVGRYIGVPAQVGAVDQCPVARDGQGKERLTQSKDPHHGVQQAFRLEDENVPVALGGPGEGDQIDGQPDEQQIEQRSHHFICLFDASADAEGHDDHRHRHPHQLPKDVAAGGGAEVGIKGGHALHLGQTAGEGLEGILKDPAGDHRIADGQGQGAQHWDQPQQLAGLITAETHSGGLSEGVDRAGASGAAKGHLSDHAGGADDDHEDQIGDQKGGPAIGGYPGGEQPDIAHSHRRTDAGQNKAPLGAPGVAFCTLQHGVTSFAGPQRRAGFRIFNHTTVLGKNNS